MAHTMTLLVSILWWPFSCFIRAAHAAKLGACWAPLYSSFKQHRIFNHHFYKYNVLLSYWMLWGASVVQTSRYKRSFSTHVLQSSAIKTKLRNSLWPSNAMRWHWSGITLAQIMAFVAWRCQAITWTIVNLSSKVSCVIQLYSTDHIGWN